VLVLVQILRGSLVNDIGLRRVEIQPGQRLMIDHCYGNSAVGGKMKSQSCLTNPHRMIPTPFRREDKTCILASIVEVSISGLSLGFGGSVTFLKHLETGTVYSKRQLASQW
jgi:hypothetical protein